MKRFLNSLEQAEEFIIAHPTEAKAILQKHYEYGNEYVTTTWADYQFSLSIDESLISAMEDEARWTIANNLTTVETVPDFVNYIYIDGLKAIKPGGVNIIE